MIFFLVFLCWGSFLNALAYRLVHDVDFWRARSFCPNCHHTIYWYHNIPIISWLWLRGKCAYCKARISILYPFIEVLTALLMYTLLVTAPAIYFPAYFLFFSALIVSIRTDLETMLISRFVTLFLIPTGFVLSALKFLPLTPIDGILGALFGYVLLWTVNFVFSRIKGYDDLGLGDAELLALVGSYTGIVGCWLSLLIGSLTGSIVGIIYLLLTGSKKIPFGPFLSFGALAYVLLKPFLLSFLLRW